MRDLPTRYGVLSVPNAADDVIVRFLQRYGEWGWDETCFIADNLRDGARVADIGAFLGTFGLGLAKQRRLGFVCFVETNSTLMPLLARNVERNCEAQSAVIEAAIAPAGAELTEGVYCEGNLGSLSYASRARAPGSRTVGAPVETKDLAALRVQFGEFDLIKIDVEGLELDILRGELASLVESRAALWIEANEDPETIELAATLIEAGMNVHYFAFSSFNPDNFRSDERPIFPFAYEAGLYASVGAPPVLSEALRAHKPIFTKIRNRDDLARALWATPRWGMAQWVGRTLPEVVALAGRELRGEVFANFLDPSAKIDASTAPRSALEQRLKRTEEGLSRAESIALERLEQLRRLDEQLGTAASLALERLALIGLERDRVRERDAQIGNLHAELQAAASEAANQRHARQAVEEQLRAALHALRQSQDEQRATAERAEGLASALRTIEASSTWRATGAARRFLSRRPMLRNTLRTLARAAYRVARPRPRQ